jgi:hypothetical protein
VQRKKSFFDLKSTEQQHEAKKKWFSGQEQAKTARIFLDIDGKRCQEGHAQKELFCLKNGKIDG